MYLQLVPGIKKAGILPPLLISKQFIRAVAGTVLISYLARCIESDASAFACRFESFCVVCELGV